MHNVFLVSTLLLIAHWVIILGLSLRIIMQRRPTGVTLAWMAIIFSVPYAGVGMYVLFGEKRLGRTRLRRTAEILGVLRETRGPDEPSDEVEAGLSAVGAELLHEHCRRVAGFAGHGGNEVTLLTDFEAVFDAMIADIDGARHTCDLEFYIWYTGGRADDVAEAVMNAARRGVSCRVLIDALGSKAYARAGGPRRLRDAGVRVVEALPVGPLRALFIRTDLRNHRKIAVIDRKVAYTGSQNLVDPRYFKQDSGVGEWIDAMARIEGPAVGSLAETFEVDWCLETGETFEPLEPVVPGRRTTTDDAIIQVVPSGPAYRPDAIHQLLLTTIYLAREELIITTPYFVPDDATTTALLSAALRGVEVTIILPARNDSLLVRCASAAGFDDLLSAGVRIAQFTGGLLHTKSITVDRKLCVFGSVNLDMRSIWLNFEISLFVYGMNATGRVRDLQQRYIAQSDMLDLTAWRKRPYANRLVENTLRLFGPLL